jgi:hypothetical protein
VIDWIEKNIDPPGTEKKNRGAIFKTIGDIMAVVSADAKKAYNAHFPYLADESKLEEHGRALNIPHLMYDKPDEFRNRVAAASFYLMKAGERGFILDILKERFGDRFEVIENFLRLQAKVMDLTDEERAWVFSLLDSLIDPNVALDIINVILREAYAEAFCGAVIKAGGTVHFPAAENDANAIMAAVPAINKTVDIPASENDAVAYMAVVPQVKCCINFSVGEVL